MSRIAVAEISLRPLFPCCFTVSSYAIVVIAPEQGPVHHILFKRPSTIPRHRCRPRSRAPDGRLCDPAHRGRTSPSSIPCSQHRAGRWPRTGRALGCMQWNFFLSVLFHPLLSSPLSRTFASALPPRRPEFHGGLARLHDPGEFMRFFQNGERISPG